MKSIKTINIDLRLPSSNDSIKDWLLHHCYVEFRYTKIESITDWIVRILTLGFLITIFSVCCFVMWILFDLQFKWFLNDFFEVGLIKGLGYAVLGILIGYFIIFCYKYFMR